MHTRRDHCWSHRVFLNSVRVQFVRAKVVVYCRAHWERSMTRVAPVDCRWSPTADYQRGEFPRREIRGEALQLFSDVLSVWSIDWNKGKLSVDWHSHTLLQGWSNLRNSQVAVSVDCDWYPANVDLQETKDVLVRLLTFKDQLHTVESSKFIRQSSNVVFGEG